MIPLEWGICQEGNGPFICNCLDKIPPLWWEGNHFRYVELGTAYGKTIKSVREYVNQSGLNWQCIGVDLKNGWSLDIPTVQRNFKCEIIYPDNKDWNKGNDYLVLCPAQELFNKFWDDRNWIDLLIIDSCHCSDCVAGDFLAAEKFISPGGFVLFHDFVDGPGEIKPNENHGRGIEVKQALKNLDLLDGKRQGWQIVGVSAGNWPFFGIQKVI